jgi:hypothetical protein
VYDAGTAALQVVPSFRNVQRDIRKEFEKAGTLAGKDFAKEFDKAVRAGLGTIPVPSPKASEAVRAGNDTGGAFAKGFRARVEAALRNLPDLTIGASTTEAEQQIKELAAQLTALRDKRVGVEITAADAVAELDQLKVRLDELGANSPDIDVQINAALASAELTKLQAQVARVSANDIEIDANVNSAGAVASMAALGSATSVSTSHMSGLIAAGVALGPLIVPAAAAAAAAVAAIGGASVVGIAAIGTLALGFVGIGEAVGALGDAQADAGKAAASAARQHLQVAGAVEGVRAAEAGLANARASASAGAVRAAQAVRDADRSLAEAQRTAQRAQQALTTAREDAKRALQDLDTQVKEGALAQRRANLDQEEAKRDLDKVLTDPRATEAQRQQARLVYDEAVQRVASLAISQKRLVADQAKATKAGVAGSQQVQRAQEGIRDAQDGVRQANQRVADAALAASEQQRQAAFSIASAQRSIVSAQRSLTQATLATGSEGSAAMDKLKRAMGALSPEGQRFARFLFGLKPILSELRAVAQKNLLPGVEAGIRAAMPALPAFTSLIGTLASSLGSLATQAGKALGSPFWIKFFGYLQKIAGPTLEGIFSVIENLAEVFASLLMAFEPVQRQMGVGLVKLTAGFADFIAKAVGGKGFTTFVDYILRNGPTVAHLFGSLAKIVGKLLVGLAPLGEAAMRVLGALADGLARLNPTALLAVAAGIGVVVAALGGPIVGGVLVIVAALGLFAGAFTMVWKASQTFRDHVKSAVDTVKVVFRSVWGFVRDILRSWGTTTDGIKATVVRAFEVVSAGWSALADNLALRWYAVVKPALEQLNKVVLFMWHNVTGPFFRFLAGAVAALGGQLQKAYNGVQQLLQSTAGGQQLAAGRVRQSEQNLSGAIRDAKQAQVELTQARRDAKQALDDLNSKVQNAALNERQASLSVKQAKQELDRVKADPKADKLQREQAQLTFDQAVQHQTDVRAETVKTKAEKADADKKGVEGSNQVKAAADNYRDAVGKVGTAEDDLQKKRTAQNDAQKGQASGFGAFLIGVYNGVIAPVWEAIKSVITNSWEAVKAVFNAMWAYIAGILGPVFTWLYDHAIGPAWTAIQAAIAIAWAGMKVSFGLMQIGIKILAAVFSWLYDHTIKPLWDAISSRIAWVWTNIIKPIFAAFGGFIKDKVAPAFKAGVDAIGKAWLAIQEVAKKPVKFVVEEILNKGILAGYNKIAKLFHVTPDNVHIDLPKTFADGGEVWGGQRGKDSVPALLMPDEHVWTTREVAAAGGHGAMHRLRQAALSGELRGFADGGGVFGRLKKRFDSTLGVVIGKGHDLIAGSVSGLLGPLARSVKDLVAGMPGGSSPFGKALAGLPTRMVDELVTWVRGKDDKANKDAAAGTWSGTPAPGLIGDMQRWALNQKGKRYSFGAVGPGAYDCSGLVGNFLAMAQNQPLYRRYFLANLPSVKSQTNLVPGAGKQFTVYIGGSVGSGHTAANIGGLHAEAYGGNGVPLAIGRVGTPLSYYHSKFHLPGLAAGGSVLNAPLKERIQSFLLNGWPEPPVLFDQGGWLEPGLTLAHNATGRRERVVDDATWARIEGSGANRGGGLALRVRVDDGAVRGLVHVEVEEAFGVLADAKVYGTG